MNTELEKKSEYIIWHELHQLKQSISHIEKELDKIIEKNIITSKNNK